MITEEEAKTKWCPFARVHQVDNVASTAINRIPDPSGKYDAQGNVPACTPGASLCLGSACMAWCSQSQWRRRSDYPWEDGEPTIDALNTERRKIGFCGLAGKP